MKIGSVEIMGRAVLAPMAGVTDLPFRMICARMGAALTYTEMVSAKGLYYSPEQSAELLAGADDLQPNAAQLFGNEPELMADMALQHALCYDVIDINMGCPVPKIVKSGQGSALMREPELAGRIVRVMSDRVPRPITVKIRKGWSDGDANAVDFARMLEQNGAAAVAVHGRTREQFYAGQADWQVIADVKRHLNIPVIGNGDVFDGQSAKAMLEQTGCDAVMVGRGAQGNPWIFAEIAAHLNGRAYQKPPLAEIAACALGHAKALEGLKGERIAVQEMRKHLSWYIKSIPQAARWRGALNSVENIGRIAELLAEITQSNPG